jgi:hypothetical protein
MSTAQFSGAGGGGYCANHEHPTRIDLRFNHWLGNRHRAAAQDWP